MSESYPNSRNSSENASETDLFEWLEADYLFNSSRALRYDQLTQSLATLHTQKNDVLKALVSMHSEEWGSDQQQIALADLDDTCCRIPETISNNLMYFFALNFNHDQRINYTAGLLKQVDPRELNAVHIPLPTDEPLYDTERLRQLFKDTPEPSIPATIQELIDQQLNLFTLDVADHYGYDTL